MNRIKPMLQFGLGRLSMASGHVQLFRCFTSQDASVALRPFFFVVHPDLFGKYPVERAVNENSLKCLNEYLSSPYAAGKTGQHQKLMFYIRSQDSFGQECLQAVTVKLPTSANLRDLVVKILNSFDLSSTHVPPQTDSSTSANVNRPVEWHPSFYAAYDRVDPNRKHSQKEMVVTLRRWLSENIERARSHKAAVRFIQNDISNLLNQLKAELNLADVRFDSVWGIQHFRGCLLSFNRLVQTHSSFMKHVLTGKTLVFSNCSGVSRIGEIILSSEDVPQTWLKVLESINSYETVLARLPLMESKLSELLNGACIVRREKKLGHMLAQRYELLLNKLINSVRRCQDHVKLTFGSRSLSHLHIRVEGEHNPLMLSSEGQFVIPASVPGPMVVDFICENMNKAALILLDASSLLAEEESCCVNVRASLVLEDLQKDESINPSQMISCCSRLLEENWKLVDSKGEPGLSGSRLRVSHYYSVMQDGLICIPWDWAGEDVT